MRLLAARHPDRQQVARGTHLDSRAIGDPGQDILEPAGADQIGGGLEHAVQALLHRLELVLEHRRSAREDSLLLRASSADQVTRYSQAGAPKAEQRSCSTEAGGRPKSMVG